MIKQFLSHSGAALCAFVASTLVGTNALAANYTQSGAFAADNTTVPYTFTVSGPSQVSLYTTSYGGGMNLDGTMAAAGGFEPVLTLFSSNGAPVASDGGSGMQMGSSMRDPNTGLYDDAFISTMLNSGSYTVVLSQFPNVAIGNMSDGFLFASDAHLTGNACGNPSGSFLQSDLAPCVQRTGNFALNVSTGAATPEPATALLVIPALGAAFFLRKRIAARA